MIPNILQIINGHAQKHKKSCGTSVCELLLKLEGKVPPDLQQYESNNSNGLDHIDGKTYCGITFRKDKGPLRALVERELAVGRAVEVFVPNDHFWSGVPDIHAWAVVGVIAFNSNQCALFSSKYSEWGNNEGKQDLFYPVPLQQLDQVPATDIVRYEVNP